MTEQDLNIIINAKDNTKSAFDSSQRSVGSFKSKLEDLQPSFKKVAVAGTIAFGAVAAVAVTSFKAYTDAQAQTIATNVSLANSFRSLSQKELINLSKSVDTTRSAMSGLMKAAQEAGAAAVKMAFDDEEAARSFAKLFSVTKDVTKANQELTMAMDLARFKGISLEDATQKLIMVHSGATKELKLLGIQVDENATAEENLAAIHKQTAESAEAFADSAKGAMERLKVQTDNLKESIGGALAPMMAKLFEKVTPLVEKFTAWAEKNPDLLAKIIMIAGAVAGFIAVVGTLGIALNGVIAAFTILAGPVGIIMGIIIALGFAVMQVMRIFTILKEDGDLIWLGIKTSIEEKITKIKNIIASALSFIKETWEKVWGGIKSFFVGIWDTITSSAKTAIAAIKGFLQPIVDMINSVINKLESIGKSVGGGIKKAINWVGDKVGINDGIVQNGHVITTHPDDYIIAMKNPAALAGGGITVNINGGQYLSEAAALEMGDMIIKALQLQMRGS